MDFAKSVGLRLLKSATAKKIGKKLINYGTAYVGRKIVGDLTKKSIPKHKSIKKVNKKVKKPKKTVLSTKKQKGQGSIVKNTKTKKCKTKNIKNKPRLRDIFT